MRIREIEQTLTLTTKRVVVVAFAICVFLFSQQCAPLQAQESKTVRMAYSAVSISFLNIFVARDAGLFKKHGLEVELIQMAGPLPVAALAAGEIDYLTGYTTGIVATGQGAPLKGIMISLRKPPFFLVAEPAVQRAADLAGKRIGVDRIGSLQHLVARLMLKNKGTDPEKAIFTQTGSVSNTVTSLGQGAVAAAILSGPHNVIMTQKGFRQIGSADELQTHFPTSGLVVNDNKLKSDAARIKTVIRVMLDATAFCRKERTWVVNYIKDRWKVEQRTAETVYDQWLSILTPDGKISVKDMQEYFDLAYSQKQISAPINVAAVTDYSLLDQVLAGK
ncbi:MAG TPA: ABC transporter substrate-binding protein [Candidatus Binatia bacterium]|nr:ABC transporter substrate-binding protein [Candidatus Binatia bacterium]